MWTQAIRQVNGWRAWLLAVMAALMLAALPIYAQDDTPTPEDAYTCVLHDNWNELYLKFPESGFLAGTHHYYGDSGCRTLLPHNSMVAGDGVANASNRDGAWRTCQANITNKVSAVGKWFNIWACYAGDELYEPPEPGQPTVGFQSMGRVVRSTQAEALAACQGRWPGVGTIMATSDSRSWHCLESWTLGPVPSPTATSAASPTVTPTLEPTLVPRSGCVNVRPYIYWLFPESNFLNGEVGTYLTNQCQPEGMFVQRVSADGYVYTADGQSAAAALCVAGHGGNGVYQALQLAFNRELYACRLVPPTPTATSTPVQITAVEGGACILDFNENDYSPADIVHYSPTSLLYLKYPATKYLPPGRALYYSDSSCENPVHLLEITGFDAYYYKGIWAGGFVHASDRDAAWEICEANTTNKLVEIGPRNIVLQEW